MADRGRGRSTAKRGRGGATRDNSYNTAPRQSGYDSAIVQNFHVYCALIDDNNDRRERIVKLSRDITIGSKRLISLLQRVENSPSVRKRPAQHDAATETAPATSIPTPAPDHLDVSGDARVPHTDSSVDPQSKGEEMELAQRDMAVIFDNIRTLSHELEGQEYDRFQRSFSPGLQEMVEALTLYHYMRTNTLLPLEDLNAMMNKKDDSIASSPPRPPFEVQIVDYLLGLCDLTGELMRVCINRATRGDRASCYDIMDFCKQIYMRFKSVGRGMPHEVNKKLTVMEQSLKKVENTCCGLVVRGSEYPVGLLKDYDDDYEPDM